MTANREPVESPYRIRRKGSLLQVSFGDPAGNDTIVRFAHARLAEMTSAGELDGGGILGITGPASLPVMVTIAHVVLHRFSAVAVFDPKLDEFVVAASHEPGIAVGQRLTRAQLDRWLLAGRDGPR